MRNWILVLIALGPLYVVRNLLYSTGRFAGFHSWFASLWIVGGVVAILSIVQSAYFVRDMPWRKKAGVKAGCEAVTLMMHHALQSVGQISPDIQDSQVSLKKDEDGYTAIFTAGAKSTSTSDGFSSDANQDLPRDAALLNACMDELSGPVDNATHPVAHLELTTGRKVHHWFAIRPKFALLAEHAGSRSVLRIGGTVEAVPGMLGAGGFGLNVEWNIMKQIYKSTKPIFWFKEELRIIKQQNRKSTPSYFA